MSADPPRLVATAYFRRRKPAPQGPILAASVEKLFGDKTAEATVVKAFDRIGAPVADYTNGAIGYQQSNGFASVLRIDGAEVQVICCSTLPGGNARLIMEKCAQIALEIQPNIQGKGWSWEVIPSDVDGNRLPVSALPPESSLTEGGVLHAPLFDIIFALAAVALSWVVESCILNVDRHDMTLGALLAFVVLTLRGGAAWLFDRDKGSYRFKGAGRG